MRAWSGYLTDARDGWRSTRRLVALRWRTVRSAGARSGIFTAATIYMLGLIICSQMGYVFQLFAQQSDGVAGILARLWALFLAVGLMGVLGSAAIGSAIAIAVFAPFTGTATLSLASADDVAGIRPSRNHRYFDSLLLNAMSGLGLIQLLALTAVASLLTMDGQHAAALVFAWSLWIALQTLMTGIGWSLEWVVRRYGKARRRLLGLGLAAVVVSAIAVDPDHGSTLFGASPLFTTVSRLGLDGWTVEATLVPVLVIMVALLLAATGFQIQRQALLLPLPSAAQGLTRRYRDVGKSASGIAFRLLARTMWRTSEIRRPVMAVVVTAVPASAFINANLYTQMSLTLAIPLTFSLAWATNSLAVLGPGMSWLGSQPRLLNRLPAMAALLQMLVSAALLLAVVTVGTIAGNMSVETLPVILTSGLLASVGCTAASIATAVFRPIRARLSGRGDALVPPVTSLAYMVGQLVLAGFPLGVLATGLTPQIQGSILSGYLAVMVTVIALVLLSWKSPERRSQAIARVAGD